MEKRLYSSHSATGRQIRALLGRQIDSQSKELGRWIVGATWPVILCVWFAMRLARGF